MNDAFWPQPDYSRKITMHKTIASLLAITSLTAATVITTAGPAAAAGCSFAAPLPVKSGSNVTATATVTDCSTNWKLTLQRHSWGPVWNNLAWTYHSGDGSFSVTTGCAGNGTRTYRTVLEASGRQSVSGHARFGC